MDSTIRRVLYAIGWWRRTFAFDTTREYGYGYSLGGTYSIRLGFEHPELIAAILSSSGKVDFSLESDPESLSAFNSGTLYRLSLTKLWGTTATNPPTSEGVPVSSEVHEHPLPA